MMKHALRQAYRTLPLFVISWLLCVGAFAQERKITGRITDGNDSSPLPGANVVVKGTQTGVVTDANGQFSLNVAAGRDVLTVSAIGYASQDIAIGNRSALTIAMTADIKTLNEVVVTGYGAQAKRDITGAVATVDTKQLLSIPATNVGQALQGRVAGVQVGNENSPGGGVMVRIRGFGTINDNSPLYVIDGVPTKGNLNTLNLNDVESMQILKDASAASIYGSRAGNGVVIITTKKGKAGKPKFTYDTYYGSQRHGKLLDLLNTQEYAQLTWESRINSGAVGANGKPDPLAVWQWPNASHPRLRAAQWRVGQRPTCGTECRWHLPQLQQRYQFARFQPDYQVEQNRHELDGRTLPDSPHPESSVGRVGRQRKRSLCHVAQLLQPAGHHAVHGLQTLFTALEHGVQR